MFQIILIKKVILTNASFFLNDKINTPALIKEIAWNHHTGNSDCILDVNDNFVEYKKHWITKMKGESGGKPTGRGKSKEERSGRKRGRGSTRTETKHLVPLSQCASNLSTHSTYVTNSDICGQMSLLIILRNTDHFVFYLWVAITDFLFLHV